MIVYVPKSPKGELSYMHARQNEDALVKSFVGSWAQLEKQGWRIVRCQLKEINDEQS